MYGLPSNRDVRVESRRYPADRRLRPRHGWGVAALAQVDDILRLGKLLRPIATATSM